MVKNTEQPSYHHGLRFGVSSSLIVSSLVEALGRAADYKAGDCKMGGGGGWNPPNFPAAPLLPEALTRACGPYRPVPALFCKLIFQQAPEKVSHGCTRMDTDRKQNELSVFTRNAPERAAPLREPPWRSGFINCIRGLKFGFFCNLFRDLKS